MEKNIAITIEKVSNGYIVYPRNGHDGIELTGSTNVYETKETLIKFINEHFADSDK